MGYTVQFVCKSKVLARMTGELLAKYYPSSNGKDTVEEECWDLKSNQQSETRKS